jgi:outer membrane protein
VDTGKLFNEFKMSKELKSKMDIVSLEKKRIVDSLYNEMSKMSSIFNSANVKPTELEIKNAKLLEQEYYYRQKQFTEESQKLDMDYTSKIWTQLNEYLDEYGKNKKYDFILGANGEGNLLYAKDDIDVTMDVVQFVNNKYEGKK